MSSEFKLPELGENVHGGDVLRVLVKSGDAVTAEQPVLELETDKATIEVPSSVAGTVGEVKVKPGEKVTVGQVIFTLSGNGAAAATKAQAQPADAAAEGGLSQRADADRGARAAGREEAVEEREGDKPGTAEPPQAQRAPIARQPEDEIVDAPKPRRGEVVDIGRGARPEAQGAAAAADSGPAPAAAPSVRRIARELGVDIRQVAGTGPSSRITTEDVQAFVREAMASGGGAAGVPAAQPLPDFSEWGELDQKPSNNIPR